jgi:hypothetical protein
MDTIQGTLQVAATKKGKEFKVRYTSPKGKEMSSVVLPNARYFAETDATDGAAVTIELGGNMQPAKVTIDGKPQHEPHPVKKAAPQQQQGGGYRPQNMAPSVPQRQPAHRDATAPYNFIPYDPRAIVDALDPPQTPLYSGTLTCSLKALTPLLVCGPQDRENDRNRRFLEVNGKKVIPGTSLKGMLRSLIEALSFSALDPMNKGGLVYRSIHDSDYSRWMDEEKVKAGWLEHQGADYSIHETAWRSAAKASQSERENWKQVQTGLNVPKRKGEKRQNNIYYIAPQKYVCATHAVDRDIVRRFLDQLTDGQEEILKSRNVSRKLEKPCPVFFVLNDEGQVHFFGLPRCFRLPYEQRPIDLAGKRLGYDFASRLFGAVGKGDDSSFKGRVSVLPAVLTNVRNFQTRSLPLLQPHATCIAHYLEQGDEVTTLPKATDKNDPDSMQNYNKKNAKLSGRKWYWHREWDPNVPDLVPGTQKTNSILHPIEPVKEGPIGQFRIVLDRLCREELGALLEALELPEGHAHKLGMGKAIGLGSVRLTLESMNVQEVGARYRRPLASRLNGKQAANDNAFKQQARNAFKDFILGELKKRGVSAADYEGLQAIKSLRDMMDFAHKPSNEATRNMTLDDFRPKAILPPALEIFEKNKPRQ